MLRRVKSYLGEADVTHRQLSRSRGKLGTRSTCDAVLQRRWIFLQVSARARVRVEFPRAPSCLRGAHHAGYRQL